MKCLICHAVSNTVHVAEDWSEVACSAGCGRFRVSANLIKSMKGRNESFDIERTRQWLKMSRNDEPVPLISRYDYNVALLHRDTGEKSVIAPSRSRQPLTSD
ncbi:hypothetical protein SRABI123_00089 [Pseudomonas sp. Bi123]|uniref:Uncharacterized protein n=2 Tax=Pseudomonas TaxID=286 RepID=A0AB33EHP8_9PSED|nr:hypothetical protein CNN82_19130 [Pseudomonas frederiksbergensis]CAH0126237.1 hypothetical protein SRABI123_00089 [Pseudomonas sp. Bi123]